MTSGKRMIDNYEVLHAVRLDGVETIVAEDLSAEKPYLLCELALGGTFGIERYRALSTTTDYLKAMRGFTQKLSARLDALHLEQMYNGGRLEGSITAEDCVQGGMDGDITGKVVALKQASIAPEFRTAHRQLMLCTGGFGTKPNARGRAVFCAEIYSGEETRWDRSDILGVVAENTLPGWAHEKLSRLREPREKESVIARIREAKANTPPAEEKPQTKNHNKSGPEH